MIRRFARPRSIIARPQRTSMKDLAEMGEVLVTYQVSRKYRLLFADHKVDRSRHVFHQR
jgi:hypothetical protein